MRTFAISGATSGNFVATSVMPYSARNGHPNMQVKTFRSRSLAEHIGARP